MTNSHPVRQQQLKSFSSSRDIDLDAFSRICKQEVVVPDYPSAIDVSKKAIVYNGSDLGLAMNPEPTRQKIKEELHYCLKEGPGVFVIQGFYQDTSIVDESSNLFKEIIKKEKTLSDHAGDHFAKAGDNERIWNSFQKVCEQQPSAFINYYQNPLYGLVAEAWLGPGYQITAQVNVVKPGGQAQSAHRDFHLGFQSDSVVAHYPLSLQVASQYLTLQGAIAHTDMPIETGPTLLLPFSQLYGQGYLAWRDERFKEYFNNHAVQLPLNKGDAIFFSPALFHAAGSNTTDKDRMANLIQISSSFSKPMETVNRYKLMKLIYVAILERVNRLTLTDRKIEAVVNAVADGYSFPSNLDVVPPVNGTAPETCQQLMLRALQEKWPESQFHQAVDRYENDRCA